MYIRELHVENVKLLRDVSLPFLRGEQVRMWTVLVGENGLGKTTLLQAIATVAAGGTRANQLANVPSFPDRRNPRSTATIVGRFTFGAINHGVRAYPLLRSRPKHSPTLESVLRIPPEHRVFSGSAHYQLPPQDGNRVTESDPLFEARAKGLPQWFVAGYGIDRKLPEPRNAPKMEDPDWQRLASLFDRGPIVGTGFADRFKKPELVRKFASRLQHALLDHPNLLPRIHRLELRGRGGARQAKHLVQGYRFAFDTGSKTVKVPATWLSQGYQATIAWIADLIGQQFWDAGRDVPLAEMEGLVLIDEIDLHLHPVWQVGLVQALKSTFPRIQFVVTTHSPMVLPGLEKDEIWRVGLNDQGNVQVEMADESPAVMTGSELYQIFFGVTGLYPSDLGEAFLRYRYLAADPFRSDDEEGELEAIRNKLSANHLLPDWLPIPRESQE